MSDLTPVNNMTLPVSPLVHASGNEVVHFKTRRVRRVITYSAEMDKLIRYKMRKRRLPTLQSYFMFLIAQDTSDVIDEVDKLDSREIYLSTRGLGFGSPARGF